MNVSTEWINQWLRRTMTDQEIITAVEASGIEIEHIEYSKSLDPNIVAGLVTKVVQHPDADRLKLTEVSIGEAKLTIVCGAPNVREGIMVPVAQVGTTLPDGTHIKASKLRGVVSEGMLCSARELGFGEDHDGLLELDSSFEPGTTLCDIYDSETILDVKTSANRPDLQSVVGITREIAALGDNQLKELVQPLVAEAGTRGKVIGELTVAPNIAPRMMIARLKFDVATLPDMSAWAPIQQRLRASGLRSISPIVDVTNYVMLEYGQPLHAYDARRVTLPFSVRFAVEGEDLETLDGTARVLSGDDIVVADANGPLGLAGVKGGAASAIHVSTDEIFLEAAVFDAIHVRLTAKRHKLRSDASARYERGIAVQLPPLALARAVELLQSIIQAELVEPVADNLRVWPWVQRVGLPLRKLNRLLGYSLSAEEACADLAKLQIKARPFNIVAEAERHLGKPYVWGASYKKHGISAFDCSYLTDYLYSLIGKRIGYTALAQYEIGRPVELAELLPGDLLFYRGKPAASADDYDVTDVATGRQKSAMIGHYYLWDQAAQAYQRREAKTEGQVGHVGMYIGNDQVIQASSTQFKAGDWVDREPGGVIRTNVQDFTENPEFLGARRFVEDLQDWITVEAVPWWRLDISIAEDLVEEVVRVRGYDQVPATLPAWQPKTVAFDTTHRKLGALKSLLVGLGMFEVMTYSFVGDDALQSAGHGDETRLKLQNPLSSEQAYLRSSLLPSHLQVLARNRKFADEFSFFELSRVFSPTTEAEQPNEPMHLAMTLLSPAEGFRKLKGIVEAIGEAWALSFTFDPAPVSGAYADGTTATILLDGAIVGTVGQLNTQWLQAHKVSGEAGYAELFLDGLLAKVQPIQAKGRQRFPGTTRDITVTLPDEVLWRDVVRSIQSATEVMPEYVTEFRGDGIPQGQRALTLRLELTHPDRTPTEAEAATLEAKARAVLDEKSHT